jgi:hypothetical protein
MKRHIAALLIAACFSGAVLAADATTEYDERATALITKVEKGEMSELDAAKAMAAMTEHLFPQDYRFQSLRNYKVLLASRFERGEIKRDEYEYLWKERVLQFNAERDQATKQDQAMRQQQAQADAQSRAVALGTAAKVFGDSLQRASQPHGLRCTTIGSSTSCF